MKVNEFKELWGEIDEGEWKIALENVKKGDPSKLDKILKKTDLPPDVIKDILFLSKYYIENKRLEEANKYNVGAHLLNQFITSPRQASLFAPIEDERKKQAELLSKSIDSFISATGLRSIDRPNFYGASLTFSQQRVLHGILKKFHETNYQGNLQIKKFTALAETYDTETDRARKVINKTYSNIKFIPQIRVTQAELIRASGYSPKKQSDVEQVVRAIEHLRRTQFYFTWQALDNVGDKKGKKRLVDKSELSPFFRIQDIRDDETKRLLYYNIEPCAVVIDQITPEHGDGSLYYSPIPRDWMEDVERVTGKKNPSRYIPVFLLWLRKWAEDVRRHNKNLSQFKKEERKKKPREYVIKKPWDEIAVTIGMRPSLYKNQRARAEKILKKALSVAVELGYLTKVENDGCNEILYLNEEFYPKPETRRINQ
jgi:hypothetical protein